MKQTLLVHLTAHRDAAQRGAVLFLVAMAASVVMIAGAIAVDLSAVATRGQSLQNAADSAALAGVQAYRNSMGERTEANETDKEIARQTVRDILVQNGITDLEPVIEFPDPENDTEVRVSLKDNDAGFLLSGFTDAVGSVEREATARFERCESGCLKEVAIPPPFSGVDTTGDGDGYKPIPVGDNLYSINHQSGNGTSQYGYDYGSGRGNRQITCVQRSEEYCWDTPGTSAYPSNIFPSKTPEMPHAAVAGTRIFWASSTDSGHYMFCFETETDSPCAQPLRLSSASEAYIFNNGNRDYRMLHRGGGTVEEDGLIYTFTDDNMVHCVVPTYPMTVCSGYPRPNGLAVLGFPANDPEIGNSGSSIDRIVDDGTDRIYSTIHVDAIAGGEVECDDDNPNVERPTGEVVLKNASSGLYISINPALTEVVDGVDPNDPYAQWEIVGGSSNGNFYYRWRNVGAYAEGFDRYLAASDDTFDTELFLVSGGYYGRVFQLDYQGATSRILTWYRGYNPDNASNEYRYVREATTVDPDTGVVDYTFASGEYEPVAADWIIRPWQCEDPDYGQLVIDGITWQTGTWLQCFDATANAACGGFTPSRIHADWDSFSGRLFFYRDAGGNPTGVCSTGFDRHWGWNLDMSTSTEVTCVDMYTGEHSSSMAASLSPFRTTLALYNTGNPFPTAADGRWGTWGDPHWNEHTNRMFYPTHRTQSRVICWDWDTSSMCPESAAIQGQSAEHGAIQDYGFFSEGNCIYGLGHNAVFWAFRADDITEECNGSSKTTTISPCDCGGNLYWGTLRFDVTTDQFEEFDIVIEDDDGNPVYPAPDDADYPDGVHSLFDHGDVIDLNHLPATDSSQQLTVEVNVVAKEGVDPWADGDGSQTFTIELGRTPRLTD